MQPAIFTSRDFIRGPNRIKRAAKEGPVIISKRSRPDIVVMSYERYVSLTKHGRSLLDRIGMPGLANIELDTSLPRDPPRDVDLSS